MYKSSGTLNLIDEDGINKSIISVVRSGANYYTYTAPNGIKELRECVADFLLKTEQMQTKADDIIITTGSQQSLNVVVDTFLKEGDTVLIEEPTYYGAIEVFKNKKINLVGVDIDENGIDLNMLEEKIEKYSPKLIYVVPTFNNPTGYSWSNDNRKAFLEIVNKHNVLVLEDAPYSLINFTGIEFKSLYNLNGGNNVIYLGTFSKIISPSLNVGYIVCNGFVDELIKVKKQYDLCTSAFLQCVVLNYLQNNDILKIMNVKNQIYKQKMQESISSLKQEYGEMIEFISKIKGGLFYMVKFKCPVDTNIFQNGNDFYLNGDHSNITRVNICSWILKR